MDNTLITFALTGVTASALCLLCMLVLIRFAPRLQLLDLPNERKRHQRATPLVGGIAIYVAIILSVVAVGAEFSVALMLWMGVVLIIGMVDDQRDLSYRFRLCLHAAIVCGVWLTDGLVITGIGSIFGGNEITVAGAGAVLFTMFAVIGAVNAINMIDGIDGLLGTLCLISILTVMAICGRAGVVVPVLAAMAGALLGFLFLNSRVFGNRVAKVFMGDAGSTLLGFLLVYMLIEFSQGESAAFSPVLAGWIIGFPLLDASAVIAARVVSGDTPFNPDRRHLHHLIIDSGKSVNQTVVMLSVFHISMIGTGLLVDQYAGVWADAILFWGFLLLLVLRVAGARFVAAQSKLASHHGAEIVDVVPAHENIPTLAHRAVGKRIGRISRPRVISKSVNS